MTIKITGIEAAFMESRGEGAFSIIGRIITFKSANMTWQWEHRSPKEAASTLRLLRAAPKHQEKLSA